MKNRRIILDIDSILNLLKDYTAAEGSLPPDAIPLSFKINPQEKGKLAILAESPSFTSDSPIFLTFQLKRIYSV